MTRVLRVAFFLALAAPVPSRAAGFSDWAAIVVAGDYHAHSGAESEVFDNARRDIGQALRGIGFAPGNIEEFSVRPERYAGQNLQTSDQGNIASALWDLSKRAPGGCFVYFTSHGSQDGVIVNDKAVSPDAMARIVGNACGSVPSVVVISACYSGVFVRALSAPNRMVFTAAASDRTSFGCGEQDKYTFFDTCFLQSLPGTMDFPDLGRAVTACVAAREQQVGAFPSEPQLSVGADVADKLHWR